jgi:hypothetical protein
VEAPGVGVAETHPMLVVAVAGLLEDINELVPHLESQGMLKSHDLETISFSNHV